MKDDAKVEGKDETEGMTLGEHMALTDELESRSGEIAEAVQAELDRAFEVYAEITVVRCDERPLDEGDREEVVDILAAAICDASDLTFTFVALSLGPKEPDVDVEKESEPDVEEVQVAIHGRRPTHAVAHDDDVSVGTEEPEVPVPLAYKECMACHSPTTQLDVNQCPMCGNPFS